ncbi:hypothetical protein [Enterococcus sp. LJL51]|uniref:hypothetical protein n=1 Tax=Enterococcus sp. LJL51 TaxID=3416656 RepID=UPI003CEFB681
MSKNEKLKKIFDLATELDCEPVMFEEENFIEVKPRVGYDLERIQGVADKESVQLKVNHMYLQELEESDKELSNLCTILNIGGIAYEMVGINKKILKYRIVIFPASPTIENALKNDLKKFEKVEVIFEKGAIQAAGDEGATEDGSERGERLGQKKKLVKVLNSWGVEYQVIDVETVEIYPTTHDLTKKIQNQLREYPLLNLVFKKDKYVKVPMSRSEKTEILKDLAAKFKKYGNGYLEMKNPFTIIAYAKSEKLAETYRKMFSEYWYKYVEVDGEIKTLKMDVEPLYKNGDMFSIEEWSLIKSKAEAICENLQDVDLVFNSVGEVVIKAEKFEKVKGLFYLKNYHDRKLVADNDKGFVYTKIEFDLKK